MASRSEFLSSYKEEIEHDNGINSVIDFSKEENYKKEDKVILFDFDSVIHQCLYSGYSENLDEFGKKIRNPEYTEDDLEVVFGKLTEMTLKILLSVEKYYNILALYIVVQGKGNFRKEIYPDYKIHRKEPNPIIRKVYNYAKVAHQTVSLDNCESDDFLATLSNKIDNSGIIISIDSDLSLLPGIHYNFNKDIWFKVSEEEAQYNFYKKLVVGDSGDHIPGAKGVGIKWVEANMNITFTKEQYEEVALQAYLKASKGLLELAKSDLELNRQLITLKIME